MCKLASSELVEKEAAEEVCKLIKEHFPSVKIQPDCETVVSALWDKIKAQWPKVRIASWLRQVQRISRSSCASLRPQNWLRKESTEEVYNSSKSTSHLEDAARL